jgi:hypothetical protein
MVGVMMPGLHPTGRRSSRIKLVCWWLCADASSRLTKHFLPGLCGGGRGLAFLAALPLRPGRRWLLALGPRPANLSTIPGVQLGLGVGRHAVSEWILARRQAAGFAISLERLI